MVIEGPPFPLKIDGNNFPDARTKLTRTFYHRPGQDPAAIEQHYDADTGAGDWFTQAHAHSQPQ
jgi:hypothetical protein